MEQPAAGVGDRGVGAQDVGAFGGKYAAALRGYVDAPGPPGLDVAAELGRLARAVDLSMLQVVGMHLEVRRAIVFERGVEHLAALDEFLSTTLAAFESDAPGNGADLEPADRGRLEWLRGLSDAYIAIAAGDTLEERAAEVRIQAKRFLAAADSRLVLGRQVDTEDMPDDGHEISAHLMGSAGLLTVTALRGRLWTETERAALQQLAALISAPINDARRLESAQRAGELGVLLGGLADPDDILNRILADGQALIGADQLIVRFFDGNGHDRNALAAAGADEAIDEVARTGQATFIDRPAGTDDPSWAVLPVGSGGTRFGVLALGYDDPQPFDEVQQSFLSDVGRRLTAALDRSRAYARERTARHEAESASERLQNLQGLAADLARAATRRRVAQVLLRRAVASAHAAGGVVATFTTYPSVEVLADSGPFRDEQWADVGVLVDVLRDRLGSRGRATSPVIDGPSLPAPLAASAAAHGLAQFACQPIMSGEREIGLLVLGWSDLVSGRTVDHDLLQAQVAMAGSTLRRAARYDVEHTIADTLQRSLLALAPITMDEVRWSVLYRAGSAGLAGGDWYDLIELDGHRLAIVVGDIVGRGVESAASMGQLRSATRALASRIDAPDEMIAALDQFVSGRGPGRFSSLAYVVLDSDRGTLAYSIAGHPPPILRDRHGTTGLLTSGRGPLLGVPCERYAAATAIEPGTSIVLYTDGLVERRGESIDVGIDRLVTTLRGNAALAGPEETCRDLVDKLIDSRATADESSDDVAIVVVELRAPVTSQP